MNTKKTYMKCSTCNLVKQNNSAILINGKLYCYECGTVIMKRNKEKLTLTDRVTQKINDLQNDIRVAKDNVAQIYQNENFADLMAASLIVEQLCFTIDILEEIIDQK